MLINSWKVALAVLLVLSATGSGVGVVAVGAAGSGRVANAQQPPTQPPRADSKNPPPPEKAQEPPKQTPLALLRQKTREGYRINAGDVLGIYVEGVLGKPNEAPPVTMSSNPAQPPAIGFPIPVQEDGTITLPFIKPIAVKGKSPAEVRQQLIEAYIEANVVVAGKERVFVTMMQPRGHRVTVIRRDIPGIQAQTIDLPSSENDVLNALVKSGGIPAPEADVVITIQRHEDAPDLSRDVISEFKIPLKPRPGETQPFGVDCVLETGAVVIVEHRQASGRSAARTAETPAIVTLAVAVPDGRILIQISGGSAASPWQLFDAAKVTATESDGRAIDAKALAERLKTMTTVLVATNGRAPTAAHLQAVKPGTLVLTVQSTH
jgi:protein involved in polysaccharide export with SLBB domain